MLTQDVSNDIVLDEDFPPYAVNAVEASKLARRKQLKRMYPTIAEIDSLSDVEVQFTMDRTLHYMLHLDQTFSMDHNFDYDHFHKMKEQGAIYAAWLETDDNIPYPSELKYSSVVVVESSAEDDENVEPQYVVIDNELVAISPINSEPKTTKKPRSASSRSAFHQAKAIYVEDTQAGRSRSSTLDRFVSELGMKPNTANVYYSKLKHA